MEEMIYYMIYDSHKRGYLLWDELAEESKIYSDSFSAVFIVAIPHKIELRVNQEASIPFKAIDKGKERICQLIVTGPTRYDDASSFAYVVTEEYGTFYFRLTPFNRYKGDQLQGLQLYNLESYSTEKLDRVCKEEQFFFVGGK